LKAAFISSGKGSALGIPNAVRVADKCQQIALKEFVRVFSEFA